MRGDGLRGRIGNRGQVLLLIGFIWLLTSWTISQSPPTSRPLAPHEEIPTWIREAAWVITGATAMAFAFVRQGRDKWGYFALMLMPAERTLSWAAAIVLHYTSPTPYPPLALSAGQFLLWLATSLLIYVIAGWEERGTVVLIPGDEKR